jgi:serine/threonine-protein kinase
MPAAVNPADVDPADVSPADAGNAAGQANAVVAEHVESPAPSPATVEAGDSANRVLLPDRQKTVISRSRPEGSSSLPPPINPLEMAVMLEGQRLGHFQLGQFVGGGGMGAVFRAVDTMLDRTVAVKILSRSHNDDEIIRRFKNEAQSAARLDHPNIARVYYVGEDQGWNYIVFEFIEGVNIRDLVESKGPLSLDEAFSYTLQIAEALEHACSRDVVHRDIKPSNVLIMPDGRAKLVDMGLARLHQVEAGDNDLTASGVTLGTFDYISPEQARDPRGADVRSDLYSLGCTLFYMLTGRPPFAGTAIKKLLSHAGDAPPNARQFRADLPDEVAALVNRMMAKRPEDRYQRPSELIGEMLLLADQLGLTGAARGGTVWITKQTSPLERFAPVLVTLVSVVLLAAAVFALDHVMSQSDVPGSPHPALVLERAIVPPPAPEVSPGVSPDRSRTNTSDAAPQAAANSGTSAAVAPPEIPQSPVESSDGADSPFVASPAAPVGPLAPSAVAEVLGPMPIESLTLTEPPAVLDLRTEAAEIGYLTGSSDESGGLLSVAQPNVDAALPKPLAEIVVVGANPGEALPPRTIALDSLAQALKYAAETPTVTAIELTGGVYELDPMTIAFKRSESGEDMLTIRPRGQVAPLLVFRPRADELDPQAQMIRIVGGRRIHWSSVHFWLELPDEVAAERWSLFHLQNLASLTFNACSMTIQNVDSADRPLHRNTAFIAVDPPLAANGTSGERPVYIGLQGCIARGQAALLRAETATPVNLDWTEGLFVGSERMVEVGGRVDEPGASDRVDIHLEHVTAVVPAGLCRLDTDLDKKYQLMLDVRLEDNIFLTRSGATLLVREGPEKPDDARSLKLEYSDTGSFFTPAVPAFCWLGSDSGESREFTFGSMAEMPMAKSPRDYVEWKAPPDLDAGVHKLTKDNFLLSDTPQSAHTSGAGFHPANLPALPSPPPPKPPQ